MKTNYLLLLFLLLTTVVVGQNNDFNNGGGDFIWSNPDNWTLGVVPNTTNTDQVRLPLLVQSQVDTDITIKKIQTIFGTANANPGSIVAVAGSSTLTLDGGAVDAEVIFNPSNHNARLTFRGNVTINNSGIPGRFSFFRNANGANSTIEFDNGSILTLDSNLGTATGSNNSGFIFNGTIAGNQNLRVSTNTSVTFGSTSTNPDWGGQLVFQGNASAVVNAADNSNFYKGTTAATRIQVNGNNSSIELNGANIYEAGVTVGGSNTFTFTVNRNQNGVRNIVFSDNGTLNLEVGEEVTHLSFIDNSSADWNSGTLNITGFKEGVIRFGEDDEGITAGQLSQITADNGGKDLMLDANGYLVNVPDYTYSSGSWSPSNPIGSSDDTDNIYIADGSYNLSDVLVANSVRVESGASLNVTSSGVLDLGGDVINRGSLTFQSDADGAGQLAAFSGAIIGNNVTVERFIPKRADNKRAFRFLSSSVEGVSVADSWQQNTHITGAGGATNGFDVTTGNAPSMFTFNDGWNAVANTSEVLSHGRGYRIFIRGDRDAVLDDNDADANDDVTLSATGTLGTGSITAPDLATGNHEFSFVGNPYQAVVDLNELNSSGIEDGYAYYWDPSLAENGSFVAVNITTNSSEVIPNPASTNVDKFLRPGQAVFFRNTNTASARSIEFTEASKSVTANQTQVFSETSTAFLNIRLYTTEKYSNGLSEEDAAGLRFTENGNNAIDEADAVKMGNPGVNFAIVNGNTPLAIEHRAMPVNEEQIQLFANNLTSGNYTFRFHKANMPENTKVFLVDTYTETQIEIEEGINTFEVNVNASSAASVSPLRFSLIFDQTTLSVGDFENITKVEVYPNPTTNILYVRSSILANEDVNVKIIDLLGRNIEQFSTTINENSSLEVNTSKLHQGVYFIHVSSSKGIHLTERFIKK